MFHLTPSACCMSSLYPVSADSIAAWAQSHGLPIGAARRRYAQYVVIRAITAHGIGKQLVFKGGNALRFVYGNPRGTIDLDFTARDDVPDDGEWLRQEIESAVTDATTRRTDYKLRVQSVKRKPTSPAATFPTYQISVGYALFGDKRYKDFEKSERSLSDNVLLEISINDLVCLDHVQKIGSDTRVLVCTLDDIVAEKLRSLLQQPIRKRHRKQDVFDIARIMIDQRDAISIDLVARCLREKCAARDIDVLKSAFNADVQARARVDYDRLRDDTGDAFIPFDKAWSMVIELVRLLDIPES